MAKSIKDVSLLTNRWRNINQGEVLTKKLPILRKMTDLTQKDLANILGVSSQPITNIESDLCKMKWSLFLAIMFILDLDYNMSKYLKTVDNPYAD